MTTYPSIQSLFLTADKPPTLNPLPASTGEVRNIRRNKGTNDGITLAEKIILPPDIDWELQIDFSVSPGKIAAILGETVGTANYAAFFDTGNFQLRFSGAFGAAKDATVYMDRGIHNLTIINSATTVTYFIDGNLIHTFTVTLPFEFNTIGYNDGATDTNSVEGTTSDFKVWKYGNSTTGLLTHDMPLNETDGIFRNHAPVYNQETLTNTTFDTDIVGWTSGSGSVAYDAGNLKVTTGGNGLSITKHLHDFTTGSRYLLKITVASTDAGVVLYNYSSSLSKRLKTGIEAGKTYYHYFTADTETLNIDIRTAGGVGVVASFSEISMIRADTWGDLDEELLANGEYIEGTSSWVGTQAGDAIIDGRYHFSQSTSYTTRNQLIKTVKGATYVSRSNLSPDDQGYTQIRNSLDDVGSVLGQSAGDGHQYLEFKAEVNQSSYRLHGNSDVGSFNFGAVSVTRKFTEEALHDGDNTWSYGSFTISVSPAQFAVVLGSVSDIAIEPNSQYIVEFDVGTATGGYQLQIGDDVSTQILSGDATRKIRRLVNSGTSSGQTITTLNSNCMGGAITAIIYKVQGWGTVVNGTAGDIQEFYRDVTSNWVGPNLAPANLQASDVSSSGSGLSITDTSDGIVIHNTSGVGSRRAEIDILNTRINSRYRVVIDIKSISATAITGLLSQFVGATITDVDITTTEDSYVFEGLVATATTIKIRMYPSTDGELLLNHIEVRELISIA